MKTYPETADAKALVQRAYDLSSEAESKALYRDWASSYDNAMVDGLGYLTPTLTAQLLAEHTQNKEALVLDIGAGTGLAGEALQTLGFSQIHALDFSTEMLAVAAQRSVYRVLIEADLTAPLSMLSNERYSAIICTGTFTHAHVGADCLDELWRTLAPNGLLACTVHHQVWQSSGFAQKIPAMESAGLLRTLQQKPGPFYQSSETDEGDYIVWQKLSNP